MASFGTGLAPGFVPWGTLSTLEEGIGALSATGLSTEHIANMWEVKGVLQVVGLQCLIVDTEDLSGKSNLIVCVEDDIFKVEIGLCYHYKELRCCAQCLIEDEDFDKEIPDGISAAHKWPKAVNTARPNSAVVNAVRENQGHLQKEDQGYVDSGCSRHMTGNMSYLSDFKEFDRGYVTFGGGAKGGKITGKGTLKTGKLDFKDVYFVKELQFNLFSVSQMCDKKNSVLFTDTGCFVLSPDFKLADESQVLLKVPRKNNMYSVDMKNIVPKESLTCLVAKATLDESMLWHRRLGHVNFKTINKLVKENLVRGLPTKHFENDQTCVACLKGKQHKASFVTDDYSRFTWIFFLATKDETSGILKSFITEIENLVDKKVKIIRCDNGTEFKNRVMGEFCEKKGIKKEFSIARTPHQNGVAERRNRTLIEAARTILADSKLPTTFWAEVVNNACYVQNMVLVVKPHNKTPYEVFRGRTPLSFMRPFGCHVTILNTLDYLGKFDGKSMKRFLLDTYEMRRHLGYTTIDKEVKKRLDIRFLEDKPIIPGDGPKWLFDIDILTKSMNYVPDFAGTNSNDFVDGSLFDSSTKNASNDEPQPSGDVGKKDDDGVSKESRIDDQESPENSTQVVHTIEPSINTEPDLISLEHNVTLEATHADFFSDETEVDMSNITTTYLVPSTAKTRIHKDHSLDHVIGDAQSGVQTRRMTNKQGFISVVYEGKTHEDLHTCLFACFLSQEEPKRIAKALSNLAWVEAMKEELLQIEAIRLFLAYASFMGFMVYQMDVKSAFLYGRIKEELYVCQPPGFEDPDYLDKVYKRKDRSDLVYQKAKRGYFTFTGLQVKQKEDGIFISQDKYVAEILRKFSFTDVRTASTPIDTEKPLLKDSDGDDVDVHLYRSMIGSLMYLTSSRPDIMYLKGQPKLGLWYPRDSSFDLVAYSNSDYTGASLDRKSTTGGCQFLGCRLISWQCKKQTVVATSSTEAEYVAAASCCGQGPIVQGEQPDRNLWFLRLDLLLRPLLQMRLLPQLSQPHAFRRAIIIVSNAEDDLEDPSKQGRKIAEIDQDPAISLDVSTTEKDISTAKPVSTTGAAVTTTSVVVSTAKDKGYEAAVRLQAELEEEERQRIASVHEAASSFNIEEWDDIQARVEADEELVQRAYQSKKEHIGGYTLQQLKGYSFDEIKNLFKTTMRRVHIFFSIESEIERVIPELAAGSSKRDAKEELDQESSKRQKIGESSN
ncbi:putative ribonuclease H-like domain-containing protein [Tanacetum coccineum]|uniref:Ribonuclease H-like domain-containing protein n=1 Tax=Tanacetum coccineum TaxID=301880 RepID=A0ABQ5F1V3_9ASTR